MALYGQSMTISYIAWNTFLNRGATGDAANHTLRWVKDGTSSAPTNTPSEVDATNAPGVYKIVLTATETQALYGTLAGKSATADVSLMPVSVAFERLPNAAPGASGGLPTVDGSNHVAGVQGTLDVNVAQISGDSTAADNLEAVLDGTGANVKFNTLTGTKVVITNAVPGEAAVNLNGSGAGGIGLLLQANDSTGVALQLNDGSDIGIGGGTSDITGIGSAAATAILSTPANKLATNASGQVELPTTDGVTAAKLRELILAALAGETELTDNGGTKTLRFFKQDGSTALLDVTFNSSGEWTDTEIDPT